MEQFSFASDKLVKWKKVEPPKFYKDYPGKFLHLNKRIKQQYGSDLLPGVYVLKNRYTDGCRNGKATLVLEWKCACCDSHFDSWVKSDILGESLHFVEPRGLIKWSHESRKKPCAYLISPYTHPNPEVREERFRAAQNVSIHLMKHGWSLLSPIVMGHGIASASSSHQFVEFEYWQEACFRMVEAADFLAVLMIDGIKESKGAGKEIEFGKKLGKPVVFIKEDPAQQYSIDLNQKFWGLTE